MYYGMLRPSEAVSLLQDECYLPAEGWGRLEFREVRSAAGREWTDDGEIRADVTCSHGRKRAASLSSRHQNAKGQAEACPDRTRAIPCTVRAVGGQTQGKR